MKSIVGGIALAVVLLSTASTSFAYYKRVVKNCDWDGQQPVCGYVKEERDIGKTDIWCEGPGTTPCPKLPYK
jgi:hypothetical protein